MANKLTFEMISQQTKNENLSTITNFNIWGRDIDDISIISKMPALQNVGLSVNKIRSLKDFAHLQYLTQLALKDNRINDFNEILYLSTCPNLRTLWLMKNPIAEHPQYRSFVILSIPSLKKLDDIPISNEERLQIEQERYYYEKSKQKQMKMEECYYQQGKGDVYKLRNEKENKYYKGGGERYMGNPYHEGQMCYEKNKYYIVSKEEESRPKRVRSYDKAKEIAYNSDPYKQYNNIMLIQEHQKQKDLYNRLSEQYNKDEFYERNKPLLSKHSKQSNSNNKRSSHDSHKAKTATVMNCLLTLLTVLNRNELEFLQTVLDKKISSI